MTDSSWGRYLANQIPRALSPKDRLEGVVRLIRYGLHYHPNDMGTIEAEVLAGLLKARGEK